MNEYHKIVTVWKRDPQTDNKTLIEGCWATPEFEYLSDLEWVFTEKVDGTNTRVVWDGSNVRFGGKTDAASIPSFLIARLQELFAIEKLADVFPESGGCLYGEGFGPKIQKKGGNYGDTVDFCLFDVFCGGLWLKREDVEEIGQKVGLQIAPVMGRGYLREAICMVREGFKSHWGDFVAEGLVMRPKVELQDRRGRRIITKVKHKDFARG